MDEAQVYEKEPEGFSRRIQIVGCYLEIEGKFLLLQGSPSKSEAGRWGVPAGKIEQNEMPIDAAARELFEETGISVACPSHIEPLSPLYIRKPDIDYVYHPFKVRIDRAPDVRISHEHQAHLWASVQEIETLPLMAGARQALEHYKNAQMRKRTGASVNAYLILREGNTLLLHLRKNSGFCDGLWSFVAGHVEDGESATAAIIREAREEIGVEIAPSELKVIHVMHRMTNRLNVDLFFDCCSWQGTIQNLEPHKCEALAFFPTSALPSAIVDYNQRVLESIAKGEFYSELGWQ